MLNLTPEGGAQIPLRSLSVERSFNKPPLWCALPGNWIAAGQAIESGAASWTLEHDRLGALQDELVLVSDGGSSDHAHAEGEHRILLRDADIPGGEARYHLHKDYQNLLGLLQASPFSGSVLIADPDTLNALEAFETSEEFDAGETPTPLARYIIQPGSTDFCFIQRVLGQWNQTHPDQRMVLSYGPPWRIVGSWARHRVPVDALTIEEDVQLQGWSQLPGYPGNVVSASMITYQANKLFEIGEWNDTRDRPLPHFLERAGRIFTVGSRRDTLRPARDGTQNVEWKVELFTCAGDWPVEDHPRAGEGFSGGYWIASGLVETCDQKSVTVKLDGCNQDQATVVCHLTTLSTGPDRAQGIHMPPYPQARVMVAVPAGLYTGPPVLLGDVRESDAPGPDPSVIFASPIRMSAPKIEITNNEVSVVVDGAEVQVGSA